MWLFQSFVPESVGAEMPRLSICIPTFNRSRFLAEVLDSILAEGLLDVIEVVIADDASPDDTPDVVERYRDKFPNFRHLRHPENVGLDLNFLAVVEAATGDYVWLFGDDDVINPGGLATVLASLDRWPGIVGLTLGVADYDFAMERPVGVRQMPETQRVDGLSELFLLAIEHLGFMSALVFERQAWCDVVRECDVRSYKNYYIQLYIIGKMVSARPQWGLVFDNCVKFRTENDQFLSRLGWMDRMSVDVLAYEEIIGALFDGDESLKRKLNAKIFNIHILARIKNAKSGKLKDFHAVNAIEFLMKHYGHVGEFWLIAVPMLMAPTGLIRLSRELYQRWVPTSGARRAARINGHDVGAVRRE